MATAYDHLADAVRRRIEGIVVAHKYGRGRRQEGEPPANPIIGEGQDRRVPTVHHPLVMRHPVTGRTALYALGHGAFAIAGMANGEAEALLDGLKTHALDERHMAYLPPQIFGGRPGDLGHAADHACGHRHRRGHFQSGFAAALAYQRARSPLAPRSGSLGRRSRMTVWSECGRVVDGRGGPPPH